jgi:hypothetical protein
MTDDKPVESRFQEYKQFARKHKPTAAVIIIWLIAPTIWSVLVTVRSWNTGDLESTISSQASIINEKTADIQRLETLLTPFRTIALQRFTGPESDALMKLADQVMALDKALNSAQAELASVRVAASYPKIRRTLNVRPSGEEVTYIGNRTEFYSVSRISSPVTDYMRQFNEALNKNDRKTAEQAIDKVITAMPEWPYGYFYRGALTTNTNDFQKAVDLCSLARAVEIFEPEPLLFEALSQMYLGDQKAATHLLDELEQTGIKPSDIDSIPFPPNCPTSLLERVDAIVAELGMHPSHIP